uniref:C-factor-like n=1 Tax=Geotrypetes seraphini TaxID=260995 RepID=A0A6P8QQT5_GEOSA|nr:C-factor-like [Geotrypetes seraphini]
MAESVPRTFLITGCNRGIGLELVKQLLAKPNPPEKVFATCRSPGTSQSQELINLAAKHPNLSVIKLETTDPVSVAEAMKEVEKQLKGHGLNVLINNAGILQESSLESVDEKDLLNVFTTNVVGPMLVTKAFLPLLKKAAQENPQGEMNWTRAAMINMSSVGSSIEKTSETFLWWPLLSYRCSKAALNMLTRCQALGYKKDGILCTAIHPGWVQTDLGGPKAPLTVDQSVSGMLQVFCNLTETQNGILVDWEGKTIPW